MIIKKDNNKTIYTCSVCGHTTDNSDPSTAIKIFKEKITTYEPFEEKTKTGLRQGAKPVEHIAYFCPICNKKQISI